MRSEIVLLSGNANHPIANEISDWLSVPQTPSLVGTYSDGETRVEIQESIRGRDVFIVQSLCYPANHHIMEALILVDACLRASANTITLVAPYFGYARQERKSSLRTPISAKLVANLLLAAGVNRLLTMELHSSAIQGFFNVPVDHLMAKPVFTEYFTTKLLAEKENTVVVSPDAGGVERARSFAKQLDLGLAVIDKRRDRPNESTVRHIIGDVTGKHCLIIDDIVDTAGSLVNAAESLKEAGCTTVTAGITHAVLSGDAVKKLNASQAVTKLVVTNTIPLSAEALKSSKIEQISVSNLMAKAISRIHRQESVSELFI
jgi:ribose-phosphate pyrophosphokinase